MGSRIPQVGMHATVGNVRGIIVKNDDTLRTEWKGRTINSPLVDISTSEGLLVNIPVRNLN